MARYGIDSLHKGSNVRCRKIFGICLQRRAWWAWCDCGWDRIYSKRWRAEYHLYSHLKSYTHENDQREGNRNR